MRVFISGPGGVAHCDECGHRIVFRKNYLERMDALRQKADKHKCDPDILRLVKLAEENKCDVDRLAMFLDISRDEFDGRPDLNEFIAWAVNHKYDKEQVEAAILD